MAALKSLKAHNILLFNFYCVLFVQLILNWNITDCNNNANVWKFVFMALLFGRIIIDESYTN